jgi:putative acetyltransferase
MFLSSDGWALVLNSTYRSIFDFGTHDPDTLTVDVLGGDVDFYLFCGDSLRELLSRVTDITGKPAMLPKFAYGLTLVQNEQLDTRGLLWDIRTIRELDIPCDTMGLEPAWMEKFYDYSTNKSWSRERFHLPTWKPANQSDHFSFFYPMRRMGMQLSLWLCENYDLFYEEEKVSPHPEKADFPPEAEIADIKRYVPDALRHVAHLIMTTDDHGTATGFIGVEGNRIEMLFISTSERGKGLGRKLIEHAVARHSATTVTVNEQNPQAVGFYEHLGFTIYDRSTLDEQGRPYPLLYMRL